MKSSIILLLSFFVCLNVKSQGSFNSLADFLNYATNKSITLQSNDIKVIQAKQGRLAAILSIPDIQATVNGSFTDNTKLPVSLFPAETFGGAPGTYREIKTGIRYNTAFSQYVDIKLVNLEGWQNLKLARLNTKISSLDVQLHKKALQENIASLYYNIIQLQHQQQITEQFIANADTILQVVTNRHHEGTAKQQEINDAKINLLNQTENKSQIAYLIKQNYTSLKMACDIPEVENIILTEQFTENIVQQPLVAMQNLLSTKSLQLQEDYSLVSYRKAKVGFMPSLSVVAGNNYNLYNNDFKVLSGKWINSNYVGLKLNYTLPNANMITNRNNAKYTYLLSVKNKEQAQIQAQLNTVQLDNDLQKAVSQYQNYQTVLSIQQDTYLKNKNLYSENVIALDRLITSFNNVVTAQYNLTSGKAAVQLAHTKNDINNKFSNNE